MNKSVGKRLIIAAAKKLNYKEEILEFILMYNVTPPGKTGHLMFKRCIRDKISNTDDISAEVIDSPARDDLINKQN